MKIFKYSKIFKSSMGKCLQRWFRARLSEKKPFALRTEEKEANTERPGYLVLWAEIRREQQAQTPGATAESESYSK